MLKQFNLKDKFDLDFLQFDLAINKLNDFL